MAKNSFTLQIGSLLFEKESLCYVAFSLLLAGLLAGLMSIIHIDNPEISIIVSLPLLFSMVIPVIIFAKGIRKVKVLN